MNAKANIPMILFIRNVYYEHGDFQVKLYEYGFKPSPIRWVFWLVGFMIGFGSRLLGKRAILKVGVFVESKATEHYTHLLKIDWDEATRKIVEKDKSNKDGHIANWRKMRDQL